MAILNKRILPTTKYSFPKEISIVKFNSKIIVISVETGNWIILENEKQLDYFNLLKVYDIDGALKNFDGQYSDAQNVVTQIEARNFCNLNVSKTEHKKIWFCITNKCNLNCPHCFMFSGLQEPNELSENEIIDFLCRSKSQGYEKVTFTGGEIVTRTDLDSILKRTYEIGYNIEILTNGTLWTKEKIDKLSPYISSVQVSIDGYDEFENSKIRGKGNFEKSLQTVDMFLKHNIPTRIAVTPYWDGNLNNKIDFYVNFSNDLLEKYKDKKFEINYTVEILDGRNVKLSNVEKKEYTDTVKKITKKLTKVKDSAFINRHRSFKILDNCSFGGFYINSTGDVYACSRISEIPPYGNIRKDEFETILAKSENAKKISSIDNLKPCCNCELKYICGGGCRLIEFANFNKSADYENINIPPRICSKKNKEFFYQIMIDCNSDIFQ